MKEQLEEKRYKKVIELMNSNREKRLRGEHVAIPWSLPKISKVLPGIEQRRYNLISAPPKGGKTQITDFLFMYEPLNWKAQHPDSPITLKIFYFSLEMSIDSKIRAAISHKLFKDYGLSISPQKLTSVFGDYVYDNPVKGTIESKEFLQWLEEFEDTVEFYDNIRNPTGIYRTVEAYAEANGTYKKKIIPWVDIDQDGKKFRYDKEVKGDYTPNNPDEFVIIIVDHVSLLQTEKGQSLHQAISTFSSQYCLKMRDKWGYIPTVVQQQSAASSSLKQGGNKKAALELVRPDQEGLADNKYTARDVDLMLSLYNPSRYDIDEYRGWDLNRIGDYHREVNINLNRNGISKATCQLYFNGASSYFSELPAQASEEVHRDIERIAKDNI